MADEEPGVATYHRIQSALDNAVAGEGLFRIGRGDVTYPIKYAAKGTPPVIGDMRFIKAVTGKDAELHATVTDEDRRVLKEKQDVIDEANLHKKFFETFHPFDDPVRYTILRKIWPEPFERMKKTLEEKAELQKRVQASLLDDLDKEGIITLLAIHENPEFQSALDRPIGPVRGASSADPSDLPNFQRGFFSPLFYKRAKQINSLGEGYRDYNPQQPTRVGQTGKAELSQTTSGIWGLWAPRDASTGPQGATNLAVGAPAAL